MRKASLFKLVITWLLVVLMVLGNFNLSPPVVQAADEAFDFKGYCNAEDPNMSEEKRGDKLKGILHPRLILNVAENNTLPAGGEFEISLMASLSGVAEGKALENVQIDITYPEDMECNVLAFDFIFVDDKEPGLLKVQITKIDLALAHLYSFGIKFKNRTTADGSEAEVYISAIHWFEPDKPFEAPAYATAQISHDTPETGVTLKATAAASWEVSNHATAYPTYNTQSDWSEGENSGTLYFPGSAFSFSLTDLFAGQETGVVDATDIRVQSVLTWDSELTLRPDMLQLADGCTAELVEQAGNSNLPVPHILLTWQVPAESIGNHSYTGTVTLSQATWTLAASQIFAKDQAYSANVYHDLYAGEANQSKTYAGTTITLGQALQTFPITWKANLLERQTVTVNKPKDNTVPPTKPDPELLANAFSKTNSGYPYVDKNGRNQVRKETTNRIDPAVNDPNFRLIRFTLANFNTTGIQQEVQGLEVADIAQGYTALLKLPATAADFSNLPDNDDRRENAYIAEALSPVELVTGRYGGVSGAYTIIIYYADGAIASWQQDFATPGTIDLKAKHPTAYNPDTTRVVGVRLLYGDVPANFSVAAAPVLTYSVDPAPDVLKDIKGEEIALGDSFTLQNEAYVTYTTLGDDGQTYERYREADVVYRLLSAESSKTVTPTENLKPGDVLEFTLTYQHGGEGDAQKLRILDTVSSDEVDPEGYHYELVDSDSDPDSDPDKVLADLVSVERILLDGSVETIYEKAENDPEAYRPYPAYPDLPGRVSHFTGDGRENGLEADLYDKTHIPWLIDFTTDNLKIGESVILKFKTEINKDLVINSEQELGNNFAILWLPVTPGDKGWVPGPESGVGVKLKLSPVYPRVSLTQAAVNENGETITKIEKRFAEVFTEDYLYFKSEAANRSSTASSLPYSVLVEVLPAGLSYQDTVAVEKNSTELDSDNYFEHILPDYEMTDGSKRDVLVFVFKESLDLRSANDYDMFRVIYKAAYKLDANDKPLVLNQSKDSNGYVPMLSDAYFYPLADNKGDAALLNFELASGTMRTSLEYPADDLTRQLASNQLVKEIVAQAMAAPAADPDAPLLASGDEDLQRAGRATATLLLRSGVQRADIVKYSMNPVQVGGDIFTYVRYDYQVKPTMLGDELRYLLQIGNRSIEDVEVEAVYDILPLGVTVDLNNLKITAHTAPRSSNEASDYSKTYYDLNGAPIVKTINPDNIQVSLDTVQVNGQERQRLTFRFSPDYQYSGMVDPLPASDKLTLHGVDDVLCIQYSVWANTEEKYAAGGAFQDLFNGSQDGLSATVQNEFGIVVANQVEPASDGIHTTAPNDVWTSAEAGKYFPTDGRLFTARSNTTFQVNALSAGIRKHHMEVQNNDFTRQFKPYTEIQNFYLNQRVFWGIDIILGGGSARDLENYLIFDILPSGFSYRTGSAKMRDLGSAETGNGQTIGDPDSSYSFADGRTLLVWNAAALGPYATITRAAQEQTFRLTYEATVGSAEIIGQYTNNAFLAVDNFLFPGKTSTLAGSTVYLDRNSDFTNEVLNKLGIDSSYCCIKATAAIQFSTILGASANKTITYDGQTASGGAALVVEEGGEFSYTYELYNLRNRAFTEIQIADLFPQIADRGIVFSNTARRSGWLPKYVFDSVVVETVIGGKASKLPADAYEVYLRPATDVFANLVYRENGQITGFDLAENNWVKADEYQSLYPDTLPDALLVNLYQTGAQGPENSLELQSGETLRLTFKMQTPLDLNITEHGTVAWNSAAFKLKATNDSNAYVAETPAVGARLSTASLSVHKTVSGPLGDTAFQFELSGVDDQGDPVTFTNGETVYPFTLTVDAQTKQATFNYGKALPFGVYTLTEKTATLGSRFNGVQFSGDAATSVGSTATIDISSNRLYLVEVTNTYRGSSGGGGGGDNPDEPEKPEKPQEPEPEPEEPKPENPQPGPGTEPEPPGTTTPEPPNQNLPPKHNETNTLVPQDDGSILELDENGVPLGRWYLDNGVWIFEGDHPLGNLPQTGSAGVSLSLVFIRVILLLAGIYLVIRLVRAKW